jgi:hypothetical protein
MSILFDDNTNVFVTCAFLRIRGITYLSNMRDRTCMSLVTTPGNLPTFGGCDSQLLEIRRYGSNMPYVFDLQFQGDHTLGLVDHPKNN